MPHPYWSLVYLSALFLISLSQVTAAEKRPIQVNDLYLLKRVAAPQISPDGTQVAYQITTVSLEKNNSITSIWVAASDGKSPPRQLTNSGKRDAHPRWSPDSKKILFESNRSGSSQLWVLDVTLGGEATQLTDISSGAAEGIWSRDGKNVAFVSAVYPEWSEKPFALSDRLNRDRNDDVEKSPVKVRVFNKLFFRHWADYVGDKREHLFVISSDGSNCRDVTPGDRDAQPTSSTFSSGDDFTFSPDSQYLVFTAVPEKDEAWSTNYDVCRVSINKPSTKWETLTKDNPAADGGPKFSPDGTKLAWRAQRKPGYEADKWDVLVAACKPDGTVTGKPRNMTGWESSVSPMEYCWAGNASIYYIADNAGGQPLFESSLDQKSGNVSTDTSLKGYFSSPSSDFEGKRIACIHARMDQPAEVFLKQTQTNTPIANISRANAEVLSQLDLKRPESVEVPVEGGVKMHMWILKPPGFDPAKKWPVVYLVHGGPQSAWEDGWSWRWNPQVWAAWGYVVVMPNPRGSTGFGQKFVDEISGDWGGKCYRDLVAGLDHVCALPYVDKDRIGGAGGSFGGYMMDWFAVNDVAKRFKCLISHCSVWNFESMWGTTDELWFDELEHGGLPWEVPGKYREFSPHTKSANLGKNKTPMLVIHNDLDFRCPIGQGHELFAALQRQGVPSRFVNFPDEGHWVLKPRNSQYWHKEVHDWLTKYAPPGGK